MKAEGIFIVEDLPNSRIMHDVRVEGLLRRADSEKRKVFAFH